MTLHGVDVSNWQGNIDWDALRGAGCEFAFIKATESNNFYDRWFERNWNEAKRVGMVRGAYHFARPHENDAVSEAHFFLDSIKYETLEPGDILVLDMEDEKFHGDVVPWTLHWLQVVESIVGFNAIIYTGPWYLSSRMKERGGTGIEQYGLWLAAYAATPPPVPAPWSKLDVWQYTSKGKIAGISGDVDLNWAYHTRESLQALGKPKNKPPHQVDVGAMLKDMDTMSTYFDVISANLEAANVAITQMQQLLQELRSKATGS